MSDDEAKRLVQAAARVLADAALNALQADPHQWSERPCATCRVVTNTIGRSFGCYLFTEQRAEQRRRAATSSLLTDEEKR